MQEVLVLAWEGILLLQNMVSLVVREEVSCG